MNRKLLEYINTKGMSFFNIRYTSACEIVQSMRVEQSKENHLAKNIKQNITECHLLQCP